MSAETASPFSVNRIVRIAALMSQIQCSHGKHTETHGQGQASRTRKTDRTRPKPQSVRACPARL